MTQQTKLHDVVSGEVRAHLARSRKTQRDLSELLGISQPQVSARLRGSVVWDVDEIAAIAQWLGVPVSDLVRDAA